MSKRKYLVLLQKSAHRRPSRPRSRPVTRTDAADVCRLQRVEGEVQRRHSGHGRQAEIRRARGDRVRGGGRAVRGGQGGGRRLHDRFRGEATTAPSRWSGPVRPSMPREHPGNPRDERSQDVSAPSRRADQETRHHRRVWWNTTSGTSTADWWRYWSAAWGFTTSKRWKMPCKARSGGADGVGGERHSRQPGRVAVPRGAQPPARRAAKGPGAPAHPGWRCGPGRRATAKSRSHLRSPAKYATSSCACCSSAAMRRFPRNHGWCWR